MSVATENLCKERHPRKDHQCVMGDGHAGSHRLGGIDERDATDRWVTKCTDQECIYHEQSVGINAGFTQCLHCGGLRPIPFTTQEQIAHYAQERQKAWEQMANELRKERNYHAQHHQEWQERYGIDTVDLLRQVDGRDQLIDLMAENLGFSVHERFLFDRHTQNIARNLETLVAERKEASKAWRAVNMALGAFRAKEGSQEFNVSFSEAARQAIGILGRVFGVRNIQNIPKPSQ